MGGLDLGVGEGGKFVGCWKWNCWDWNLLGCRGASGMRKSGLTKGGKVLSGLRVLYLGIWGVWGLYGCHFCGDGALAIDLVLYPPLGHGLWVD